MRRSIDRGRALGQAISVAIEHSSATAFIHWANDAFSQENLRSVRFSTSICFDLSIFEMFVTLNRGGQLVLADNALHLAELPAAREVTPINTVPSATPFGRPVEPEV